MLFLRNPTEIKQTKQQTDGVKTWFKKSPSNKWRSREAEEQYKGQKLSSSLNTVLQCFAKVSQDFVFLSGLFQYRFPPLPPWGWGARPRSGASQPDASNTNVETFPSCYNVQYNMSYQRVFKSIWTYLCSDSNRERKKKQDHKASLKITKNRHDLYANELVSPLEFLWNAALDYTEEIWTVL